MSRAFVRESDDRPELPMRRQPSVLPPGAKNYLTADGAERLRDELRGMVEVQRPPLAAESDDPEMKRRLLMLDQRIQQLEESIRSAEIVQPPAETDTVRFGATVVVRRAAGEEDEYRIVGVDEVDPDRGWVSWLSPIAKALLNAQLGDGVRFRFPSGEEQLEIVRISYAMGT
ncbi:MAG: GreA/GreB family elongation factor [Chthoniobacterales bacterium]|nr:GreA/GreB family elongation factor [Chthoniobacterales bacterium]